MKCVGIVVLLAVVGELVSSCATGTVGNEPDESAQAVLPPCPELRGYPYCKDGRHIDLSKERRIALARSDGSG